MKTTIRNLLTATLLVVASVQIYAQGLVYDQESDTSPINVQTPGVDGFYLSDEPLEQFTQSFIPSFSAIDFVALEFEGGTGPATVDVNLYGGSPYVYAETLLATTTPITIPDGFPNSMLGDAGVEYFYFSNPVSLTPGDTYYLEPLLVSGGDQLAVVTIGDTYANGELLINGNPTASPNDMWFQEGIVTVPEPATIALVGLSSLLAFVFKRRPKLPVLLFASVLLTVQTLSADAAADSVVQTIADAAGLTPVSANTVP